MPGWRLPSGCYRATGSGKATKGSETSTQSASTSQFCLSDPTPPPTEPVDICEGQSGDWQCSPIVINLADGPWKLSGAEDPVSFDIDADGLPNRITWTGRSEPLAFLALDRNSNGIVDDGSELFGTATRLRTGARAPSGFEALKELDVNGDDVIDASDGIWSDLFLWTDINHDGVSQANEIGSTDRSPVVALSTDYREVHRLDAAGNTFRYMSSVRLKREQRPYYDIFFQPVP